MPPIQPGRLIQKPAWLVLPVLELLLLALRLPFRSPVLINWDSVNYALGMLDFDITRHRPHPPGYILYVKAAKLLQPIVQDANTSLIWIGVLASMLTLVFIYLFACRRFEAGEALFSALLFITNPLVWWYDEVALSYSVEAFFSIAVAYACYRALEGSVPWTYGAAILLGLSGGFRQNTLFFLLPLAIYTWLHTGWRERLGALVTVAGICLAWFVPLIHGSGGPMGYLQASAQLSAVSTPGPVLDLVKSLLYAGHLPLLLAGGVWLGWYPFLGGTPKSWERIFNLVWIAPGLTFMALRHMGQSGYVLYALPVLFIYTPALVRSLLTAWEMHKPPERRNLAVIIPKTQITLTAFLCIQVIVFFLGGYQIIRMQTLRWGTAKNLPEQFDPAHTLVLTDLNRADGFRSTSYYLSDYPVYSFYTLNPLAGPLNLENPNALVSGWAFYSYRLQDNYDLNPATTRLHMKLDLPGEIHGLLLTSEILPAFLAYRPDGQTPQPLPMQMVKGWMTYIPLPAGVTQLVVHEGLLELR